MIGVINLGNSNLTSLTNSLVYLGVNFKIITSSEQLDLVDKIILPGVGTFKNGIKKLIDLELFESILFQVNIKNKPILGICLGMQLLFQASEESPGVTGLSLLEGKSVKIPNTENVNVPRIGWANSILTSDFLGMSSEFETDFYYIHSFCVELVNPDILSIKSGINITAAVQSGNIYGCQFHPEKSHLDGLTILKEFSLIS